MRRGLSLGALRRQLQGWLGGTLKLVVALLLEPSPPSCGEPQRRAGAGGRILAEGVQRHVIRGGSSHSCRQAQEAQELSPAPTTNRESESCWHYSATEVGVPGWGGGREYGVWILVADPVLKLGGAKTQVARARKPTNTNCVAVSGPRAPCSLCGGLVHNLPPCISTRTSISVCFPAAHGARRSKDSGV